MPSCNLHATSGLPAKACRVRSKVTEVTATASVLSAYDQAPTVASSRRDEELPWCDSPALKCGKYPREYQPGVPACRVPLLRHAVVPIDIRYDIMNSRRVHNRKFALLHQRVCSLNRHAGLLRSMPADGKRESFSPDPVTAVHCRISIEGGKDAWLLSIVDAGGVKVSGRWPAFALRRRCAISRSRSRRTSGCKIEAGIFRLKRTDSRRSAARVWVRNPRVAHEEKQQREKLLRTHPAQKLSETGKEGDLNGRTGNVILVRLSRTKSSHSSASCHSSHLQRPAPGCSRQMSFFISSI